MSSLFNPLRPLNPPIADWRGKAVWVVGASSGIGRAVALALLAAGARVALSARNGAALESIAELERAAALVLPLDVADRAAVQAAEAARSRVHGPLDLVLFCAGTYQPMRADAAFSLDVMLAHQQVNYVGALHVLDAVLPGLLARRGGHIALVGSVAGYRGLPNSLAYGPTKAAMTNLAEILYLDLSPRGIGVSMVQPGFVDTPLTAQNDFAMPALITTHEAAQDMLAGWARGAFEIHFPKRFTRWLKLLRLLPYRLYFPAVRRFTGL